MTNGETFAPVDFLMFKLLRLVYSLSTTYKVIKNNFLNKDENFENVSNTIKPAIDYWLWTKLVK